MMAGASVVLQRAALCAALFVFMAPAATVTMLLPLSRTAAAAKEDRGLIAAAGRGDAAAVRRLLEGGASLSARDGRGARHCLPRPTVTTSGSRAR